MRGANRQNAFPNFHPMSYELIIEGEEGAALIHFLKQLDFVTIKPLEETSEPPIIANNNGEDLAYFDAAPDWGIDAATLRAASNTRRPASW